MIEGGALSGHMRFFPYHYRGATMLELWMMSCQVNSHISSPKVWCSLAGEGRSRGGVWELQAGCDAYERGQCQQGDTCLEESHQEPRGIRLSVLLHPPTLALWSFLIFERVWEPV